MSDFYAETLADLHAKKRDIDRAIKSLERICSWQAPPENEAASEETVRQKPLLDVVIEVLRNHGEIMSPAEIVQTLEASGFEIPGLDKYRNIGAVLNRGKKSGLLINRERAQWGLAEWDSTDASELEQRAGPPLSALLGSSDHA